MPDAIPSHSLQLWVQGGFSKSLQTLLKGGAQQATVLNHSAGGKLTLILQGQTFTLETKGTGFKPGNQVMLRMSGERVIIQSRVRSSSHEAKTVSAKTLASTLTAMGVSSEQSQPLARAMIQAGMPLEPQVLKTLTDLLGKIFSEQTAGLTYLLSRGFVITPSLVSVLTRLFSNRQRPGEATHRLLLGLSGLLSDLDELEEPLIRPHHRDQLGDLLHQLHERIPTFSSSTNTPSEEEWAELIRSVLTTSEALLQKHGAEGKNSFAELHLRLLILLHELKPMVEGTAQEAKWRALLSQAQEAYEALASQSLRNQPLQDSFQTPIYLQLPISLDDEQQTLELLYISKDSGNKSGNLDLRLDLSSLGPLFISIQWSQQSLTLSLVCESENVSNFLQDSVHMLESTLREKGFVVQAIHVHVDEIPTTLEPKNSPPPSFSQEGLDIRI